MNRIKKLEKEFNTTRWTFFFFFVLMLISMGIIQTEVDDISTRLENAPQRHCHNEDVIKRYSATPYCTTYERIYNGELSNFSTCYPKVIYYEEEATQVSCDDGVFVFEKQNRLEFFKDNQTCLVTIQEEVCEIR